MTAITQQLSEGIEQLQRDLAGLPDETGDALGELAEKLSDAIGGDEAAGHFARLTRDVITSHAKALIDLLELPELCDEEWAVAFVIARCANLQR